MTRIRELLFNAKAHGIIQIALSAAVFLRSGHLFYSYRFENILYYYMIPEWVLFLEMLMSGLCIFIGTKTFNRRLKPWIGYAIIVAVIILGFTIEETLFLSEFDVWETN